MVDTNGDGIIKAPERVAGSTVPFIVSKSPDEAGTGEGNLPRSGLTRAFLMANPALKNGYLSIATELVEEFAKRSISGSEMRILWVVWRKTWGWKDGDRKKDWDWISISQFEELTGMKHANVVKATKSLVVKRILLKGEKGVKFNQNYEEWGVVKRLPPVVKRIRGSSQTTTKSSSQMTTHNRKKETNTKERILASQSDAGLIGEIILSFEGVNPSFKRWYANTTQRGAIDRLIVSHGVEQVKKIIALLPRTNGMQFFPTITTPAQLEDKWAQLESALRRKKEEISNKKKIFV